MWLVGCGRLMRDKEGNALNLLFAGLGRVDVAVLESGRGGKRTARRSRSRKLCRRRPRSRQTLRLCSERCGGGGGGGGLAVAPGMLCEPLEALPKNSRGRHCVYCVGATPDRKGCLSKALSKRTIKSTKLRAIGSCREIMEMGSQIQCGARGNGVVGSGGDTFWTWTWQSAPRVARHDWDGDSNE